MKTTNNYISLSEAINLTNDGWLFRQDLQQTWFQIYKGNEIKKLNKKNAKLLKEYLNNK